MGTRQVKPMEGSKAPLTRLLLVRPCGQHKRPEGSPALDGDVLNEARGFAALRFA